MAAAMSMWLIPNNNRIQKFSTDGTFLASWGSYGSGNGQFISPHGIAVDSSGKVYVADTYNYRIQKFSPDGTFLASWGSEGSGNGQFESPDGVAVDGSGNVYVTDIGNCMTDTGNCRIQKFSPDGTFLTSLGSETPLNGQFYHPWGIAVDGSGKVYVAGYDNYIYAFTPDGTFLTSWGSYGSGNGQFISLHGLAADASGRVYVADTDNHRIQKFSSDGDFLATWGSYGSGNGQFYSPLWSSRGWQRQCLCG